MLDSLSPFWKNIYVRQTDYEKIYDPLMKSFDEEEWIDTVADLNAKSAAGPSGI